MECATRKDFMALDGASSSLKAAARPSLHAAICDGCDRFIVGTRLHCLTCVDFDLCESCDEEMRAQSLPCKDHTAAHSVLYLTRPVPPGLLVDLLHHSTHESIAAPRRCQCGQEFAPFGCTVCGTWHCSGCRDGHNSHHAFIRAGDGVRDASIPILPALWGGAQPSEELAGRPEASKPVKRKAAQILPMQESHIDGVLAIEASSFSEPYPRETFCMLLHPQNQGRSWCYIADVDGDVAGYLILEAPNIAKQSATALNEAFGVFSGQAKVPSEEEIVRMRHEARAADDKLAKLDASIPTARASADPSQVAEAIAAIEEVREEAERLRTQLAIADSLVGVEEPKPCQIVSLGVSPRFRGCGCGAGLMSQALQDARERGQTEATLHVDVGNQAAINLYERFGFEKQRRILGYYSEGIERVDAWYMVATLK